MRIAVFDTNSRKFTTDMMEHWRSQGHEVSFLHTFHLPHAIAADVLWFDCIDGSLRTATKDHWRVIEGKKVIARGIDIDIWAHHFPTVDWSKVDHLVFGAKHIQDYMLNSITLPDNLQVHHIPFGVNLEKFTLRQDITPNNRIAFVANLWSGKGLDLLWQLIALMPEYHFYICGRWGMSSLEERWHKRYIGQFLEPCGNWTHVERVPDMNEWLDDKTFTLICSKKEAFSYAAAEGMAKGLMPVIHDFYGASNIWPGRFRWRTVVGAAKMIRSRTYEPVEYRQYIGETYPLPKMLRAMDELLEG